MVTHACDQLIPWLLTHFPQMEYGSISANFCTDKKVSAVNGILGRGKNLVCESIIPRKLVERYLKSTPEKMIELNVRKNLIGTALAGGLRSANAHYANMLLGFYLAMGQDAANIVEGSQGMVHMEMEGQDLYVSVNTPNIIVGSVGNGKGLDFVRHNLEAIGCTQERPAGENARRLAAVAAGCVACGELSLIAAQTNPGELMASHLRIERQNAL
jgi:hydroxymethylglutaryl-CoA reductase (NADPH)